MAGIEKRDYNEEDIVRRIFEYNIFFFCCVVYNIKIITCFLHNILIINIIITFIDK